MPNKFLTKGTSYFLLGNLWIKLVESEQNLELWWKYNEDSLQKGQLPEIISYLDSVNLCSFRKQKIFSGLI